MNNAPENNHEALKPLSNRPTVAPRVDVYQNDKEYLLLADLPGVTQENLSVEIEKRTLTLEATMADLPELEAVELQWRPVDFRRTFAIPNDVETDAIGAKLLDGVLRVHLPRTQAHLPRKIQVNMA